MILVSKYWSRLPLVLVRVNSSSVFLRALYLLILVIVAVGLVFFSNLMLWSIHHSRLSLLLGLLVERLLDIAVHDVKLLRMLDWSFHVFVDDVARRWRLATLVEWILIDLGLIWALVDSLRSDHPNLLLELFWWLVILDYSFQFSGRNLNGLLDYLVFFFPFFVQKHKIAGRIFDWWERFLG